MINDKVKLNKKDYHPCCNSYLAEVSRKNMVGKSKKQSPERYAKKSNYHALKYDGIDVNKLLTDDQFVVVVPVGKYECTIAFNGVIEELGTMLKMQKHGNEYSANINLQMCIRVLQRTIDNRDILVDCTCPDFCLEENTKIKLLNGKVYTVKELLQMHKNNEEIWVYSTDENGDFKPGKVTDVWVSGYSDKMLKVTLDNGESIITTPNHKYMMRDCSYKTAEELQVGNSLLSLHFNGKSMYDVVTEILSVSNIEYIDYKNPIPVYDLTVDKYNNFYVDAGVVLHNCYRFAYFATKFGYKYGKPETRPSKITNPRDDKGSVCKHLLALLSSKRWLVKLATTFNTIVHDHLYEIQDMLGMWDEDAFVNRSGVHSRTTVNRMRQANAQQKSFDKPMVVDMSDDLDLGESVEETTSKERMLR